nr:head-tail connector protein [Parvularcula maris]
MEPFSLQELKTALRIDHDADDALVMRLGVTARRFVERRLSVAIAEQSWRLTAAGVPSAPLRLAPGPVMSVDSAVVFYGDSDTGMPADSIETHRAQPSLISVTAPSSVNSERANRTEIIFRAGRSDMTLVPPDLKEAVMLLTAHYYDHRSTVERGRYVAMPLTVQSILEAHREVRL